MPEEMIVRPLTGVEVQEAVIHKIRESFSRTCHLLATNAYTSFRAEITIRLELSDHGGAPIPDNHHVVAEQTTGLLGAPSTSEAVVTMEPKPPNEVLISTGQKVDVKSTEDGKTVVRQLHYTPRKTPPPPREAGQR